jgi:hypothetical protein
MLEDVGAVTGFTAMMSSKEDVRSPDRSHEGEEGRGLGLGL